MKHLIILLSSLLLLCLNTSCEKAGQIHLISAQTWVVSSISSPSNFAQVGDELTFLDNRLFFKNSNGIESDGRWDFPIEGSSSGPITTYNLGNLLVSFDLGSFDFTVNTLTATELELEANSFSSGLFTVQLTAKE